MRLARFPVCSLVAFAWLCGGCACGESAPAERAESKPEVMLVNAPVVVASTFHEGDEAREDDLELQVVAPSEAWSNPCRATAHETPGRIVVTLSCHNEPGPAECDPERGCQVAPFDAVKLEEPLAGRKVIDGLTGKRVLLCRWPQRPDLQVDRWRCID